VTSEKNEAIEGRFSNGLIYTNERTNERMHACMQALIDFVVEFLSAADCFVNPNVIQVSIQVLGQIDALTMIVY